MMNSTDELSRVHHIVSEVQFPGYSFAVEALGDHIYVQVYYNEPDVMSGVVEEQRGRKWLLPPGQTVGQIVQTCFKAILTSLEHRAREHFLWRGKPVLQPHLDLEKVWESLPAAERFAEEVRF
jgi:hypothetical protein